MIGLPRRLHVFLDDGLGVGDGERRVLAEGFQDAFHQLFQLRVGHHAMHEAHRQPLRGVIAPAEEHDLARARVAYGLEQALVPLDVVGEAELRRRNGELRRLAAIAQVARERDLEAAAHAEAVDHRQRGLARVLDRMQHLVEQAVVLRHRLPLGADLLELGDIGACGEGFVSRAAKRDDAHFGVDVELPHRRRDAAPHLAVDGVALRRLVEDDPADRAAPLYLQAHGLPEGP